MSGKKQKALAGWFNCTKCNKRFSRHLVTKHAGDAETVCRAVHPFVKNNELFCLLNNVTTATRKIGELPFIKNKRIASSTLFLSEELIKECGFTTFTWVSLNPLTARSDQNTVGKDDSQNPVVTAVHDFPNSRYAFRVWPIPESIGSNQCNVQAILSLDGFTINILCPSNPKYDNGEDAPSGLVGVQVISSSLNSTVISSADEVTLVVTNFHEIDEMSFDIERFIQSFNKLFLGRPIALFNKFKLRFYGQFVHFYVSKISSQRQLDQDTLGMEKLSIKEESSDFYQISSVTAINVITKDNLNLKEDDNLNPRLTCADVGGLSSVITEICSTVKFILNTKLDVPKGILIYGHTGVGKTMIVQAISNEFNLFKINYEEFTRSPLGTNSDENSSTSLDKIFKDAVRMSPSVIIVEALDVISPRKKSDTKMAQFTQFVSQFLSLASSIPVKQAKVLILCTATDLERVDPNLRSPKLFAKEIEIPIPSANEREEILQKMLLRMAHELSDEDIRYIGGNTHGFVAADLLSLCHQATLDAITKSQGLHTACDCTSTKVTIQNFEVCLKSVKPSAVKSILIDIPNVKWSDIGGQDELKFKLKQAIEWPLKHPESFKRLGITSPKGILMYGPPGCSKTMIAKAIATESGLNFISVKGSELFSKWVGESEKAVQAIFRKARQVSPCVIFFDEIDSLGGERGTSSGSSNVHERVLAQILVEMDGIETLKDVTIVAATNRPDRIDQALLRPGRLDRIVYVPLPDENTRKEILKIRFQKMPIESNINIDELVKRTAGYSGAELSAVCREAALKALEEDINCELITQCHFNVVLSSMKPRISQEQIDFYGNYANSRKQV